MNEDDWRTLGLGALIGAVICLFAAAAVAAEREAPALPAGIGCDQVRETVAQLGRVRALALAIEHGATFAQIRAARRCLKPMQGERP